MPCLAANVRAAAPISVIIALFKSGTRSRHPGPASIIPPFMMSRLFSLLLDRLPSFFSLTILYHDVSCILWGQFSSSMLHSIAVCSASAHNWSNDQHQDLCTGSRLSEKRQYMSTSIFIESGEGALEAATSCFHGSVIEMNFLQPSP